MVSFLHPIFMMQLTIAFGLWKMASRFWSLNFSHLSFHSFKRHVWDIKTWFHRCYFAFIQSNLNARQFLIGHCPHYILYIVYIIYFIHVFLSWWIRTRIEQKALLSQTWYSYLVQLWSKKIINVVFVSIGASLLEYLKS